jgi:putative endonuclease
MVFIPKVGWVYIMASASGTLYIGVSSDLKWRVHQHKQDLIRGFSSRYKCHKLVFYERLETIGFAIEREKEIKGWRRDRKQGLIRQMNPSWNDLSEGWYWTEEKARGPSG